MTSRRTLLVLGKRADSDQLWIDSGFVRSIVRFENAAPSGYRAGSRLLGLGLDSAVLALKVLFRRGPFLALNPWIAVALRMLGKKDVSVVGIYAEPGSRNFRLLRRILGDSSVITMVDAEATAWVEAGGRARPVLYGNTFGYPRATERTSDEFTIFVGGMSDRGAEILARLEQELKLDASPHRLVVVSAEPPSVWSRPDGASITRTGYVSAHQFGALMSDADIVFLPLKQGTRAAGHMVTVGALELGIPVATTVTSAMQGYVDGDAVSEVDLGLPILPQLLARADRTVERREQIISFWNNRFSRRSFVDRVGRALTELDREARLEP